MGSKSAGPGGQMGNSSGDVQPFDMPPTQQPMSGYPMQPGFIVDDFGRAPPRQPQMPQYPMQPQDSFDQLLRSPLNYPRPIEDPDFNPGPPPRPQMPPGFTIFDPDFNPGPPPQRPPDFTADLGRPDFTADLGRPDVGGQPDYPTQPQMPRYPIQLDGGVVDDFVDRNPPNRQPFGLGPFPARALRAQLNYPVQQSPYSLPNLNSPRQPQISMPLPNRIPINGDGQPQFQRPQMSQQMNPAIQNALRLALSRLGIR